MSALCGNDLLRPTIRWVRPAFDEAVFLQSVNDAGDRCTIQNHTCTDVGATHPVRFGEDFQHSVLNRRHAEGRQQFAGAASDLLRGLPDNEADTILNPIQVYAFRISLAYI